MLQNKKIFSGFNKIKNKKGFIFGDSLVLLGCFIAFAFIGVVFFILFSIAGKSAVYDIKSDKALLDYNYILLNILRKPVQIDGQNMNTADLIVLWNREFIKNKYAKKLGDEIKNSLADLDNPCVIFHINYLEPGSAAETTYESYTSAIQSPKFEDSCYHSTFPSFAIIEIPSFNSAEEKDLKKSNLKVALEYRKSIN